MRRKIDSRREVMTKQEREKLVRLHGLLLGETWQEDWDEALCILARLIDPGWRPRESGDGVPADLVWLQGRLEAAERVLFARLSDIKEKVRCGNVVWQPPGWGMDYWRKGLRFGDAPNPAHFRELSRDDLHAMVAELDAFAAHVKEEHGLDIEPGDEDEADDCPDGDGE